MNPNPIVHDDPKLFEYECEAYIQNGYDVVNLRRFWRIVWSKFKIERLWVAEIELRQPAKDYTFREPTYTEMPFCIETKLQQARDRGDEAEVDRLLDELNTRKQLKRK